MFTDRPATIVQLPFPSMTEPCSFISDYYTDYSALFTEVVEDYWIPRGDLWELPLWVAHLGGMLRHLGMTVEFIDLSKTACTTEACAAVLLDHTAPDELVLLSPLAQNFDLAVAVSRVLMTEGRTTLIGGNMAPLCRDGDATHVHRGIASPDALAAMLRGGLLGLSSHRPRPGTRGRVGWRTDYSLLQHYAGRVPLLRLNASHGCLYRCNFCGDAWSRQLHVVDYDALVDEVEQFERMFPESRLIYIGDKTFGQSSEAVANLRTVFASRPQYRFIVQTHVMQVNERLIEDMRALGVVVVELGFESGDRDMMLESAKAMRSQEHYLRAIEAISRANMHVILNVMGGLPYERQRSHEQTVEFLHRARRSTWLYNLYNFVPYPLTPLFPELRERIFDWSFASWREDKPPVFHPYHLSVQQSYDLFIEKVRVAHGLISGSRRVERAAMIPIERGRLESRVPDEVTL